MKATITNILNVLTVGRNLEIFIDKCKKYNLMVPVNMTACPTKEDQAALDAAFVIYRDTLTAPGPSAIASNISVFEIYTAYKEAKSYLYNKLKSAADVQTIPNYDEAFYGAIVMRFSSIRLFYDNQYNKWLMSREGDDTVDTSVYIAKVEDDITAVSDHIADMFVRRMHDCNDYPNLHAPDIMSLITHIIIKNRMSGTDVYAANVKGYLYDARYAPINSDVWQSAMNKKKFILRYLDIQRILIHRNIDVNLLQFIAICSLFN